MGTVAFMDDLLELEVPADPANLRIVRLVALDAAERAGLDCDAADDLRIGVEELCLAALSTAIPGAVAGTLALRFRLVDESVVVHGIARLGRDRTEIGVSRVAAAILASVADGFELADTDGLVRFSLRKVKIVLEAVPT